MSGSRAARYTADLHLSLEHLPLPLDSYSRITTIAEPDP